MASVDERGISRLQAGEAQSCLTVLPDGTVGCLYERGDGQPYERLTFARFDLAWLTEGAESAGRN